MPESPVKKEQQYSPAPPGKKALSMEEMKQVFTGDMQQAAAAIGGAVDNEAKQPGGKSPEVPLTVDDEDRRRYVRSLLSKESFTKSYTLFGGVLKATFRTRKVSENETILSMPEDARYSSKLNYSLVELMLGEGKLQPIKLEDLDDVSHAAVSQSFKVFEELCDELFRRANDPDFWTRTAGRT